MRNRNGMRVYSSGVKWEKRTWLEPFPPTGPESLSAKVRALDTFNPELHTRLLQLPLSFCSPLPTFGITVIIINYLVIIRVTQDSRRENVHPLEFSRTLEYCRPIPSLLTPGLRSASWTVRIWDSRWPFGSRIDTFDLRFEKVSSSFSHSAKTLPSRNAWVLVE